MKPNYTVTFADLLEPTHPKRKCTFDFLRLSVWRKPTKEEQQENPNIVQIVEPEMFFYWKARGVKI